MELIRTFNEIGKGDASIAGGKGASLGEMTRAGIPVPPGYVVLASAFERFLEETDLNVEIDAILKTVSIDAMHTVEHASEKIQGRILKATMPEDIAGMIIHEFAQLDVEYVAVRSSATAEDSASAAWAGQLDSFLNTTRDTLLKNVQKCWASLFTPRAVFYRFEKGLHDQKISVAVVVQKMVASEKSGIAFSVHPVTEDRNQLIVEAGFGLGEAIVSGQVTPDSYVVEKDSRRIVDKNIAAQERGIFRKLGGDNEWLTIEKEKQELQKLSDTEILELAERIIQIENHYGFPCDIEWAREGGNFYIVQSRPITTLSKDFIPKLVLSKHMSREHSLFYAHVWNEANRDHFDKYIPQTNIKNMLYLLNKLGVLEVYYDLNELDRIFKNIADGITNEPEILDIVIADFYHYWNKLLPYVLRKKKIQNLKELKEYYQNWTKWWAPMAYVFVIPDQERIPKKLREKALKVREETQEYSDDGDRIFTEFVQEKYPLYAKIATLFTPQEIFKIKRLNEQEVIEIKKRSTGCALATIGGKSIFGLLKEIESKLVENNLILEQPRQTTGDDVRGLAASSGKVKGKAKLVLRKADLDSVEDGNIMITYATSPDYVPAMKRCSAIVTDEGGIVCHAAIVARELKKPCIIGTKIATQVLHDGDLVEVDADNGVVKILKKAQ